MKIEHIQSNTNFNARYLPEKLSTDIAYLKRLMEADTVIVKGQDFNKVIYTRSLSINNDEAVFKNGKFLARRNKKDELVPYGADTAMIEFGSVRIITNGNGEIIEHKKPILKKWESIFKEAEQYIQCAIDNYNNNKIVKKICNKKECLTEGGLRQAQAILNNVFVLLNPFHNKPNNI